MARYRYILGLTMYQRRGILTNLLAIVLAFSMPLCCCIVETTTGISSTSCCVVKVVEVASCCEQPTCSEDSSSKQRSKQGPCGDECTCTIKGTFFTQQWTLPVDLFGVDAPTPFFVYNDILGCDQHTAKVAHSPPKYDPSLLGFSSAPSMRGVLILQV